MVGNFQVRRSSLAEPGPGPARLIWTTIPSILRGRRLLISGAGPRVASWDVYFSVALGPWQVVPSFLLFKSSAAWEVLYNDFIAPEEVEVIPCHRPPP